VEVWHEELLMQKTSKNKKKKKGILVRQSACFVSEVTIQSSMEFAIGGYTLEAV
jgi:hypothetical protein